MTSMPSGTAGTRAGADQRARQATKRKRPAVTKSQDRPKGARSARVSIMAQRRSVLRRLGGRLAMTDREEVFVDGGRQAVVVRRRGRDE